MKKFFCCRIIAALILISAILSACSGSTVPNKVFSPEDLSGRTVGVLSDTAAEGFLDNMRNVTVRRYQSGAEMMDELKKGRIDAVVCDGGDSGTLLGYGGAKKLSEPLYEGEFFIAVSQENETLLKNVNSALSELKKSGRIDRLEEAGDVELTGDIYLTVAVCPDLYPYAYIGEDGELYGTEITLARLICEKLGVNAELRAVEADKLVYMVESGKVSIAVGRIVKDSDLVNYSEGYGAIREEILVRN